jgi:hypothetical protein
MIKQSLLVMAGLFGLWAVALAQSDETSQPEKEEEATRPPEKIRAFIKEREKTRPKLAPPPLGKPVDRVETSDVNWDAVDKLVEDVRIRDLRAQTAGQDEKDTGETAPSRGLRKMTPKSLPRVKALEIERPGLPVLVPGTPEVLESVQVFGQENSYSAIADGGEGVAIRISGSRKKVVVGSPPVVRRRLEEFRSEKKSLPQFGARYLITRSDGVTDLSFSRWGCGYIISVMCDDPYTDARCAEDDFITELASSLVLLNDRPGEPQ